MGKKSREKKVRRDAEAAQLKLVNDAVADNASYEEYLDELVGQKDAEAAHRQKEADKLLDEVTGSGDDTEVGFTVMLQEFRRLKKLVDDSEAVSIEDLDKMKAEIPVLMPRVFVRRARELRDMIDDKSTKADDRTKAIADLMEIAETAAAHAERGVPEATDAEKMRCDRIVAITTERTYHRAYLELHAMTKTRRAASFMNQYKDPSGFVTIDRMWAVGGFVQIRAKNGDFTTLTIQQAAMRAQALQDMLVRSHPWHRARWTKLVEEIVQVCREAQAQRLDRRNEGANLLREIYDGVDADGNPKKIVIDERFVHNTKKLFPLLTEDEIVAVYSDTTQGFTMAQKEKLVQEVYRQRAFDKGLNPDLLQNMEME